MPGSISQSKRWVLAIWLCGLAGGLAQPSKAETCTPIANYADLSTKIANLSGRYCLTADIDAKKSLVSGFIPIGGNIGFSGTFDGRGHVIKNLLISGGSSEVGLFTMLSAEGSIRDVGLINLSVTATQGYDVGGLVGKNSGVISDSYTTGSISGMAGSASGVAIGGLVGRNLGTISASYSTVVVTSLSTASVAIGGLSGMNFGKISQSHAIGAVSVGSNSGSQYYPNVGGLVGDNGDFYLNQYGSIVQSYATGSVTAGTGANVGGLVGNNDVGGFISNSYATGTVSGGGGVYVASLNGISASEIGGLVGNDYAGVVQSSYSVGKVTGTPPFDSSAGLAAYPTGAVTNSYWDTLTSGLLTSGGGTGLATAQLKAALPTGFDPTVWSITSGYTYPYLLWQPRGLGIDVSESAGIIDWDKVCNTGKIFAIILASRALSPETTYFPTNAAGAVNEAKCHLNVGAYHYSKPWKDSAVSEAGVFLKAAGKYVGPGFLPPVLDIEDPCTEGPGCNKLELMGKAAVSQWIRAWCGYVYTTKGVKCMIYTYTQIAQDLIEDDLAQYLLWIAFYPWDPTENPTCRRKNCFGPWKNSWVFMQYAKDNRTISGVLDADLDVSSAPVPIVAPAP